MGDKGWVEGKEGLLFWKKEAKNFWELGRVIHPGGGVFDTGLIIKPKFRS